MNRKFWEEQPLTDDDMSRINDLAGELGVMPQYLIDLYKIKDKHTLLKVLELEQNKFMAERAAYWVGY